MNIKNLKPNANSQYQQGYFQPTNPEKYIGDVTQIIYRSSWEKRFCQWANDHPNIVKWGSENFKIPYENPVAKMVNGQYVSAINNYYVDFFITIKKDDKLTTWLCEVKPKNQVPTTAQFERLSRMINEGNKTEKKIKRYNHELKTLLVNRAKFLAAMKFAEARGCKFCVCDENFLF